MKNYRLLVTTIIAIGIILIGTSNPVGSFYKGTNLIIKGFEPKSVEDNIIDKQGDENSNQDNGEKYLICIDPGHQEKGDPKLEQVAPGSSSKKARVSSGTAGVATKKAEYILNLEASMVLKHILENKGYDVVMTRETHNVNISNSERAIFANEKNADMVIRVHADSIDNSSKTGASILIPQEGGKYTSTIFEESKNCSIFVEKSMKDSGIKINGVFQRDDLTGFNWSKVPVILIEMGFMSNYNEDLMMSNPDYQTKLMQSVADGVEAYFKTK